MLGAGIRPRSDSTSQSGEQTPINSQRQRANRRRIRRLPVACSVGASWLSSTDQQQAKQHQEGQTKPPVFPCAFGRTQKHAPTASECHPTGACTQANTRRAPLGDPNVFALPPFSPLNTNLPCPASKTGEQGAKPPPPLFSFPRLFVVSIASKIVLPFRIGTDIGGVPDTGGAKPPIQ